MRFKTRFMLPIALALSPIAASDAATLITNSSTVTGLGSSNGSDYDQLIFEGISTNLTTAGLYTLGEFTLVTGANDDGTTTGTIALTGLIDGESFTVDLAYTLISSTYDMLSIASTTFTAGGYSFTTSALNYPWSNMDQTLTLTAFASETPEPATWAMYILGFGVVGGTLRRHRAQVRRLKLGAMPLS